MKEVIDNWESGPSLGMYIHLIELRSVFWELDEIMTQALQSLVDTNNAELLFDYNYNRADNFILINRLIIFTTFFASFGNGGT